MPKALKLLVLLGLLLALPSDTTARRHDVSRDYIKRPRAANLAEITPEQQNNTEVVAQVGGSASIKCYTHFIGDETVTWLKKDEDQLLTAGSVIYSSEKRYAVSHVRHQQLWELSVMDVRLSDAGTYECQMTTHPPTSLFFILKVVEARAVLQGAPEVHVQTGESLRLHCNVQRATDPPQFIFWYHNGSMINYSPPRPLEVVRHHYTSDLYISDVRWEDAGAYSCEPEKAHPANLTLHVVAGEKHAALHNGQGEGGESSNTSAQAGRPLTPLLLASSCLLLLLTTAYFDNIYGWVSAQGGSLQQPDDLHAGDVDEPQTLQQHGQEEEKEDVPGHQTRSGHHCRQVQEQQRDIYGERRIHSICSSHMEGSRTKRKRSL
ncbi:uncharacterized protein LOC127001987 [Eriocheir sinensis]|uniref:uncharacterized protein LOC127001987 n=1 Tax=Eriocheir sinensis TaxID=95602 RepID=UPI0021C96AFC|nr:uncharacterized protein LOC127001987 [Eriocheir sinensis]